MADVNPVVDTNLGPAPVVPANPIASGGGVIGVMNDLAEMRNRQNANLLFQQQMSARHQLGEDLSVWAAQGLSPEEQQVRAAHQPYAPFVAPELSSLRQSNMFGAEIGRTQAEAQEVHARAVNAGIGQLTQALAATNGEASRFPDAFAAATSGYDPGLQADIGKAYDHIKTSLTANLPKDPDKARAMVLSRTQALGAAYGLPLDKLYGMAGGVVPGVQEIPTASGADIKAIVGGGGEMPLSVTPLGAGPGTAAQEQMKVQGQQAAGLPPTLKDVTLPSGATQPMLLSGGANGASPNASPLLAPSAASAPTPIVGPSATQQKFQTDVGTNVAAYKQNLDERVSLGQNILQTLQPAWETFQDMKAHGQSTGGLQSARMALAAVAQGLGADPATVNKISRLSDTQEFSKLMGNTTMSQIIQQLPASSKLAVSEFNAFTKNNPSLDTDPAAVEKIFKFWENLQATNRVEQNEFNKHIAAGGNLSEWSAKWQQIAEDRGLVNPHPTASGALGVGESRVSAPGVTIRRVK